MRTHLICLLSALGVFAIYGLAATSGIDDLALIEQAKQEQRDSIRSQAQHDPSVRAFYRMEEPNEIQNPLLVQR